MKNSEFAELIAYIAKRMYMCGAETRLIVQTSERVAKAYGHQASVVVTPGFIGVSLKCPASGGNDSEPAEECSSFAKCREAEHGLLTQDELKQKLGEIRSFPYNPFLMIVLIGVATASFSVINGGDIPASLTGLFAGSITMAAKILMQRYHLFDMFIFTTCGFVGTISSYWIGTEIFDLSRYNLAVAMVVSLLLLVPGFPFINGVLDLFKGYIAMGTVRLIHTLILISSVSLGIILAFSILPINGW